MRLFVVLAVLGLLSVPVMAENKDRYCSLMYAIYGCCSEQLIDNYLAQTQTVAPRLKPVDAKLSGTDRPLVTPTTINVPIQEEPKKAETPEVQNPCWYWAGEWKQCRLLQ